MSTFKFEGDSKQGGLPRKCSLRVESLPGKELVFEDKVSESVYLDLDPGKYAYSVVRKSSPAQLSDAIYRGEFLHEISEEAWKAIQRFQPRLFKTIHTSEGVRWRCLHTLCSDEFSHPTAALIHEMEHFGVEREDFLADPTGAASRAAGRRSEDFAREMREIARKQGRQAQSGIPA